jgi:hypothetical protein
MKRAVFCTFLFTFFISGVIFSDETLIKPINTKDIKWSKKAEVAKFDKDVTEESMMTSVCWSPDESQIYIQSVVPGRQGITKRFMINPDGTGMEKVDKDPRWAGQYWFYKSSLESPDTDAKIEEEVSKKTLSVGKGTGGVGGTMMGTINIYRYKFHGDKIFEKKEIPIIAGECHSWAPKGGQAMIYTDHKGNLYMIGADGENKTKMEKGDLCFPCWSPSGKKIVVFKADKGGKRWTMYSIDVEGLEPAPEAAPAG